MVEKTKRTMKKWKMPSAFAIIFGITVVVAVLTWIVPSGTYTVKTDDSGNQTPIAGTYQQVEKVRTESVDGVDTTIDNRQGLWDIVKAPIEGTLRSTGPTQGAIDVMLFVLILGGFLGIVMKTGALDALFGSLIKRLKGREIWIIPILMTFFALGGTTYGMQEETVAFYALVIPLVLAAGYNGLTAAMIIILGAGVGVLGSTVNPFSTGIASGFADVSIGDGIIPRLIILGLCLVAAIWFTMRYAAKVKAGKYQQDSQRDARISRTNSAAVSAQVVPEFTTKRKWIAMLFGLTFVIMVLSVIPWAYKFDISFFEDMNSWLVSLPVIGAALGHIIPLGDWWFNELSALFFASALIIGTIHFHGHNRSSDEDDNLFGTFVAGARDLLAVALIIGFARGVSIIMTDGQIMDTIIHGGEGLLAGVHSAMLPALAFVVYLPLSFLIPSTSGLATATMPILAPLADFAHIDRSLIVTAFASSAGVVNMIAPTVASVMGGLVLAKVSYGLWIRRTWKIMLVFSLISIATITIFAVV
ncbi:MAG: hypothetical protein WAQ22_01140 [Candidatus Saccharimonas sp.]